MDSFFHILSLIIVIPFFGMIFAITARDDGLLNKNALNIGLFTGIVNLILVVRAFLLLKIDSSEIQLIERYSWFKSPNIDLVFGADTFSMLIILALQIAFVIGFFWIREIKSNKKSIVVFSLLYLSFLNGFFLSNDIFSFYFFFEAMLLPLLMLIGQFGGVKKMDGVYRFFIYNFIGALIIFIAFLMLFNTQNEVFEISAIKKLGMSDNSEIAIWGAVFIAFLSRVPIWPFHSWMATLCANIKNPLVFILANIIPLTGIYGLIRFLPRIVPLEMSFYINIVEVIALITMVIISLIGFSNKESQYKLFSFITVCYIMYLLGALHISQNIMLNIGLSFFSYIIAISSLEVLMSYISTKVDSVNVFSDGFLSKTPRLSFVFISFVFVCLGLPISSMFFNNFIIVSSILKADLSFGLIVVFCLFIASLNILQEYFKLNDASKASSEFNSSFDISKTQFVFMLFVLFVIVMSFVKPFWFVGA